MMKAISLLLVLLLHQEAANAVPVTRSVVHSVSHRSAEYDYLARQKRDATNRAHGRPADGDVPFNLRVILNMISLVIVSLSIWLML